MHINRELILKKHVDPLLRTDLRVLEIGPDAFPSTFRQLASTPPTQWDTLDIYPEERLTYSQSKPHHEAPIDCWGFIPRV